MLIAASYASKTSLGWIDSWNGIHSLTIFYPGHAIDEPYVTSLAKHFDFGWSSGPYVNAMLAGNPDFINGRYQSSIQGEGHEPSWWTTNHPDWLLYENDRTTICWQYYYQNPTLDSSNPEVVQYKLDEVRSLGNSPNQCVAWDNFALDNDFPRTSGGWGSAAGVYDKDGNWIRKYAGVGSYAEVLDPQWTDAMINYARVIRDSLHALPNPVLLIINAGPQIVTGDAVRSANLIDAVDGILWEGGNYGPGWISDSRTLWLRNLRFIEGMQAAGKACYINPPLSSTTDRIGFIRFALAYS